MKHVMLDLETFGTTPGSVIRSIGAVEFDLNGETGRSFYSNIEHQSCLDVGLTTDPDTEAWWKRQGAAAQSVLLKDTKPLCDVAAAFAKWFRDGKCDRVWGQGSAFDVVLWEQACRAARSEVPWKFWDSRDTRTIYDVCGFDTRNIVRKGVHHNALDDAYHQVALVAAALRKGLPASSAPSVFE